MSDQPFSLPTNQPSGRPLPAQPPRGVPAAPPVQQAPARPQPARQAPPAPAAQQPPMPAPTDDDAEVYEGDAVFWSVEGWSPDAPFQGSIVFTDEYGNVLTEVPVEPEAMKSLNDITTIILDEQYAAFTGGEQRRPDQQQNDDAPAPKKGQSVIEKSLMGVPIQMNVNTRNLTIIGVVLASMLLFILVKSIVS